MKEKYYEELLNIKTSGEQSWDETKKCYHPYKMDPLSRTQEKKGL